MLRALINRTVMAAPYKGPQRHGVHESITDDKKPARRRANAGCQAADPRHHTGGQTRREGHRFERGPRHGKAAEPVGRRSNRQARAGTRPQPSNKFCRPTLFRFAARPSVRCRASLLSAAKSRLRRCHPYCETGVLHESLCGLRDLLGFTILGRADE